MQNLVSSAGKIFWIAILTVVILAVFVSVIVPLAKRLPVVGGAAGSIGDKLESAAGLS